MSEVTDKELIKLRNSKAPWTEKYRPQKIEDIIIDDNMSKKIKKIIYDKEMPNIILTGNPGSGKTSSILCVAKDLLGEHYEQGVLELNASDDRGIKAQDSIIYFCKKKLDLCSNDKNFSFHKIILLDEADNMTKKAQQLVSNLMEKYHNTTRFAFTCNNSSDIIEAIQSRCIIFRYRRLSPDQVLNRLQYICKVENVPYDEEGINEIVNISQGDMRQAINSLQVIYNGYNEINLENVYKLYDIPHPAIIKNIFIACKDKNIHDAIINLNILRNKGYSSSDICSSMINTIKAHNFNIIDEETKIKFLNEICATSIIVNRGIDTPLQLSGCVAKLCSKNL